MEQSTFIADTLELAKYFGLTANAIVDITESFIDNKFPEYRYSIPFKNYWEMNCYYDDEFMIFTMQNFLGKSSFTPKIKLMDAEEANYIITQFKRNYKSDFRNLLSIFGTSYFNVDKFMYIGKSKLDISHAFEIYDAIFNDVKIIWSHWITYILIPKLFALEGEKIKKNINSSLRYDISNLIKSVWILECYETSKQGTAFALEGYGLVTCEHVLGTKTKAFLSTNTHVKYDIIIEKRHSVIDIAILKVKNFELTNFLKKGISENLEQLDQISIFGFPNYRFGDSGTVIAGHISGFRTVSTIKRFLVSMPLIAGNSGSPIFNSESEIIGIAVTGADIMENFHKTENHGIIPIETLDLL